MGSLLALRLGLPCPDVDVASVDAEALSTAPEAVRQWASPGPAFASKEIVGSVAIQSDGQLLDFAPPDFLGKMFAVDVWLDVLDRRKPDGIWNLLVQTSDHAMRVLDYGKGLTSCLFPIIGQDKPGVPFYPLGIRRFASIEAAREMAAMIANLDPREVQTVVTSVPSVWASDATKGKLGAFLMDRVGAVGLVCDQLHDENPQWRS